MDIRVLLRRIAAHSSFGALFSLKVKYFIAKFFTMLLGEKGYAKCFFKYYMKYPLNLDNPVTVAEKFWWLKLHNRDPLMTICSDKSAARDYVTEKGYEETLMTQLDVFDSVKQIDLSKYSEEVIIKCTHNSGGLLFYNPDKPQSSKEIKKKIKVLKYLLKKNASVLSLEWNYKNIKPKLIVEKVVRDSYGKLPKDYKIWCFDGVPKLVLIYSDRFHENDKFNWEHACDVYDTNFNLLDVTEDAPNSQEVLKKPDNWDYMIEMAAKLSEPFPYCRVDLYNIDGNVRFGELTFYDAGGCVSFHPKEWDDKISGWFDLNSPKIVNK